MKTSKAPAAPDPVATAQAQTGSNLATAQTNAVMNMVNQVTPDGNLTYSQSGQQFISDPTGGTMYYRGPNGEISTTRPSTTSNTGTKQKLVPYYEEGTGKQKYRFETVGGQPVTSAAEGWTELGKGYYVPTFTATQTLSPQQQAIKDQSDATELNLAKTGNQQSQRIGELLNTTLDVSKLPAAGDASSINLPTYTRFGSGPQLQTSIADAGQILREFGDAGAITKTYGGGDYETARKSVEDAMYSRLNPQLDNDRASLETSLANKGIQMGSGAWNAAMDSFGRNVSDQRTAITLAGGQEQSRLAGLDQARATFENSAQQQNYNQLLGRATFSNQAQAQQFAQNAAQAEFGNGARQTMFGNDMAVTEANNGLSDRDFAAATTKFGLQNTARQNALTEATALRQMPINEIAALLSGAQVNQPNFVNTPSTNVANTDYAGLVQQNYSNALQQWQTKVNAQNSALGAIAGVAGAGLGGWAQSGFKMSDRRVKHDVHLIGDTGRGFNLYSFAYLGSDAREVGFMADEVEAIHPEAVAEFGGIKHVNYAMLEAA